tara:strand:+ start:59 stop:589 length:531 start_codon:yes stop_codon:yes gene_type:complete
MILYSTDQAEYIGTEDYNKPIQWMYVWELIGLDLPIERSPIKLGVAKKVYSGGFHGGQARIIGNLREIELAFGVPRGTFSAKVHRFTEGEWESILGSEQFVHTRNLEQKLINILQDSDLKKWKKHGGKTEWFDSTPKQMLARASNSRRASNIEIGKEVSQWKRSKDIHGVQEFEVK